VASNDSFWVRLLLYVGGRRASEEEFGDLMEEYACGNRSAVWLARQILSTVSKRRSHATIQEGRAEMLSNLWSDTRYAWRTLRRNPGFAAAAIVPVALGIGINIGVFSILSNVALRPLPTPKPTELVNVYQEFQGVQRRRVHGARIMFSVPEYRAYRDGTRTLTGVMAYSMPWEAALGNSSLQEIEGVIVTCNYFDVLQLRPLVGTGFTAANCEAPGAPPSVIISHRLWTNTFAADPDIVRKTITLNGHDVGVAGVAPEGFDGIDLTRVAFFAPTSLQPLLHPERDFHEDAHTSWLTLVGRRTGGAAIEQVRAELAVIATQIDRQQPGRTTTLIVSPATSLSLPGARGEFLSIASVVLAAFGLVLLIACANVANLLLARAAGRTKEIAVRLAVGARRGRLIQQLLTESMMIALIGGVAGSLLAWWSFQLLLTWLLSNLPGTIPEPRIDAQPSLMVFWFALALIAMTALVCGLVPALQASKPDLHAVMKEDGAQSKGRALGWFRGTFISIQVAVCMVLLISAGLLLRALYAAQTTDPGFDYRNVAVVSFNLRGPDYDAARISAFREQVLEQLGSLPGVEAVARAGKIPLSPGRMQWEFRLPRQDEWREVDFNNVSPGYFSLIGIPILRGRTFTPTELQNPLRAAIVTESTARRYWPGEDPVGRTVFLGKNENAPLEIVGVAKDAQVSHVGETESSYLYLPAGPQPERAFQLLVRSKIELGSLTTSIAGVTRALDPSLLVRVNPLEANLEYWRTGSRMVASLSGALSLLALVLASLGVYGVVSYAVNRRRREVGIRMTLGATARDVQRLILQQTLRPVAAGMLIGTASAAAVSRVLEGVLFGVSPLDPLAFIGATLVLTVVAVAASLLPTRQALRVDPMTTLRYE
jgi:putative ABC transport system permease protein